MRPAIVLATVLAVCCYGQENNPVVTTSLGRIRGATGSVDGFAGVVHRFLTIPYAKPPLGNLRFMKPRPHPGWTGVRDGSMLGNACIQVDSPLPLPVGVDESEDCLVLNVYVPDTGYFPNTSLPVMIFVHDGGFQWGTGYYYDGAKLALTGNVIYVTLNYRLDLLGWISTGNKLIPGNTGFFDQLLAIKWVRDNIASFGGDPDEITLHGLSSGAESVMAHVYSPLSAGLFKRGIVNSAPASWQYDEPWQQRASFREFASLAGCSQRWTRNIISCLQQLDVEALRSSNYAATLPELAFDLAYRVVDGEFLTQTPREALDSGRFNDVDLIIGFTELDGNTVGTFGLGALAATTGLPVTLDDAFARGILPLPNPINGQMDLIQGLAISVALSFTLSGQPYITDFAELAEEESNAALMYNMVNQEYFTRQSRADTVADLESFMRLLSTGCFTSYSHRVAQVMSSNPNNTVYMYQFSHRSQSIVVPSTPPESIIEDLGAFHADDLYYIFGLLPFTDAADLGVQEAVMTSFTSFATDR